MTGCHDMEKGQVYACSECGLELEVKEVCKECQGDCVCEDNCEIMCCGKPLVLKK